MTICVPQPVGATKIGGRPDKEKTYDFRNTTRAAFQC